ncbi:hypothetical protein Thein_1794 [Thermodesulfatator indicus DSM 15286]|uniref:peptidylprolyl isomerase n=1 Tax=Thermodesulfatator indicus (strain DSM 15286 / JCM 11887 / CIR29812) TaxID=667014 RepID=F8ABV8_THEID|nr:peptidyl-prolyl cis-trans isomerase [Thermodesulfatator indicus]AEH45650.1 hypothetical protein Thein_1794 [Thermodesulfatator indicus DSM 15286]
METKRTFQLLNLKNSLVVFSLFYLIIIFSNSAYPFWGDNYLFKIDNRKYTKEDFLTWWKYWKEPNMKFPETPDPFIDWLLIANEAKRMELDSDPLYKHKIRVFLEVRGLLLLKNEEVDKKIDISQKRLWKEYKTNYIPRLKIKALITQDYKVANNWKKSIKTKEAFDALYEKLEKEKKARDFGWERPITIPEEIRNEVLKANKDEIVGPVKYKNTYFLLFIEDKLGSDPTDFNTVKREIIKKIRKKDEAYYTEKLIENLKKKYNVKINWDILKLISLDTIPENLKEKTVLVIGDRELKAIQFWEKFKKEIDLRFHKRKLSSEDIDKMKHFVINTYISQTLTSLEALNRHYEKEPPLKDLYEFYKKQLLVVLFEEKIIKPQIKVTEEEMKDFYTKNKEKFTRPSMVEIAVIKTRDPKLIKNVYKRIKQGENFFKIGKEIQFHTLRPEKYFLNQLVPEMRDAIKGLKPNEVSSIIEFKRGDNTWYCLVYLIKHYPEKAHPYEIVKDDIRRILEQEKFNSLKKEYINKLRAQTNIVINEKEWLKLKREMMEDNNVNLAQ